MAPIGNDGRNAGQGRLTGGLELGRHPAPPERSGGAGRIRQRVVTSLNQGYQSGIGVQPGVALVQSLDIAQNHQQIGLDEDGDQGR